MTGSTTAGPLDLTQELRARLAEAPQPATTHVETELQELAARRLGRSKGGDPGLDTQKASRSLRARMQRREPLAGAFDSPQGFVFVADAGGHRKPR